MSAEVILVSAVVVPSGVKVSCVPVEVNVVATPLLNVICLVESAWFSTMY